MDRGQAHTLEAFAAAFLLLGSVAFALQVTAVTPLTASTSSQHIENQQRATADGVLAAAATNGSLKPTLLHWNASGGRFHGAQRDGTYVSGGPPTPFGRALNRSLRDRSVAFNVNVYHLTGDYGRERRRLVYFGEPSDNAVTATRVVTLYDDDRLTNGTHAGERLSRADFYATDASPDGPVYNVVVVEVVAWRM